MSQALKELSDYLGEVKGELFDSAEIAHDELTLLASPVTLIELMTFLRDDAQCQFVSFIDICGVDWPARPERFDVVYHLLSPRQNLRIRVKIMTSEDAPVPSLTA
ncbi:MAG: NADH-quinone oxidoreductase subunit C, partial [Hoeflea sp.]|uniref:NADH-quinone oxidoreductase subunit C n=1 Tax=Hoeflea sp. TaxID=1940281 RepID=UPI0032997911